MKKVLTASLCFFPVKIVFWILNLLGHKISPKAKIGFSLIWIDGKLTMDSDSVIGHFNFIKIMNLTMFENAYLGKGNRLRGPINIILTERAAIGNKNAIYRAPIGITYGESVLKLGVLSKITANHRVDCTKSITIGNYSTIAGHNSELWTHAYYHDKTGPGRFRLDGEIEIGNNVYIGSRCVLNCGIKIGDQIMVGANSCVSKSLTRPGIYVNQELKYIESILEDQRLKFNKVTGFEIEEEVYERKNNI